MHRPTNRVTATVLPTSLATFLATFAVRVTWFAVRVTAIVVLVWSWSKPVPVLAQDATGEWRAFAADPHGTKYSALDQITADNVADLEVVWSWDAAALDAATGEQPRGFRATPLKIGDRLYVSTPLNQVVAWSSSPSAHRAVCEALSKMAARACRETRSAVFSIRSSRRAGASVELAWG